MNDKKQIEEMANIIADCRFTDPESEAIDLYNAKCRIIPEDSVVVSKEWWDKSRTQKTFKFYKDDNLSKELYLMPYSVCIRPSEDNMSLLSLYKTLVWCGYASENYWNWCENTKEAKEVSFYEYIDELIKAIQAQTRKEKAREILKELIKNCQYTFNNVGKPIIALSGDFALNIAKQYGVEIGEEV